MKILDAALFGSVNPVEAAAFRGLDADLYRGAPGANFSSLTALSRSPLDLQRERIGATKREATDAMELGTVLHSLVLENRANYTIKPETYGPDAKKWNGNATECRAWMAEHAGEIILSASEAAALNRTAAYVRNHTKAGPLVTGGVAEVACFAFDAESGLMIKGRLDYVIVTPEYVSIIDLKRTQDATTAELSKTIQYRRYHVQAAMYRRLALACGAPATRHFFIAVEDGQLPKVNVRELNPRAVDLGDAILTSELELYAECIATNNWPEWRDDGPGIACIDLPEWAYPTETIEID